MEAAGYFASALIGLSLGLIGGGGSILTVPVLVYLFSVSPTLAISYSLFVVGVTSALGAVRNHRHGLVHSRTVLLFGAASITTVFLSRRFVIPHLPDVFFRIGSFEVTHSLFVMVMFALLMLAASWSMIRGREADPDSRPAGSTSVLLGYCVLIGLVTGFLGAGGGFLLIPALVVLMKLPMKEAVGTSLAIIALNSGIGFLGDIGRHPMDWPLLLTVSAIAVAGIFAGMYLGRSIEGSALKKGFGVFVLLMGTFIIVKELLLS